jgi:hypothetical protein
LLILNVFRQTLSSTPHIFEAVGFGTRFLSHAKRVRRLFIYDRNHIRRKPGRWNHVGERNYFIVAPGILALWAAAPDLFPLLQSLKIEDSYLTRSPAHEALTSELLAHRALRSLAISFGMDDDVVPFERIQPALINACAGLHNLTLKDNYYAQTHGFWKDVVARNRWSAWSRGILTHMVHVRQVHIEMPLDYIDLRTLSMVPTVVTLHASNVVNMPSALAHLPGGAFPALRSLALTNRTGQGELFLNMLSFHPSSAFEECALRIGEDLSASADNLAVVLAAVCQHMRMAQVSIEIHYKFAPRASNVQDTSKLLRALRPSELMQSLTLNICDAFPLHRDHIAHILHLYPCLHTLNWTESVEFWCPMSLDEFMTTLKARPDLDRLPVRLTSGDLPSAKSQASFGSHGYSGRIHIEDSAASDELLAVIRELFPSSPQGLDDSETDWD